MTLIVKKEKNKIKDKRNKKRNKMEPMFVAMGGRSLLEQWHWVKNVETLKEIEEDDLFA